MPLGMMMPLPSLGAVVGAGTGGSISALGAPSPSPSPSPSSSSSSSPPSPSPFGFQPSALSGKSGGGAVSAAWAAWVRSGRCAAASPRHLQHVAARNAYDATALLCERTSAPDAADAGCLCAAPAITAGHPPAAGWRRCTPRLADHAHSLRHSDHPVDRLLRCLALAPLSAAVAGDRHYRDRHCSHPEPIAHLSSRHDTRLADGLSVWILATRPQRQLRSFLTAAARSGGLEFLGSAKGALSLASRKQDGDLHRVLLTEKTTLPEIKSPPMTCSSLPPFSSCATTLSAMNSPSAATAAAAPCHPSAALSEHKLFIDLLPGSAATAYAPPPQRVSPHCGRARPACESMGP